MTRPSPRFPGQYDPGRRRVLKLGSLAAVLPAAPALRAEPFTGAHEAAAQGFSGPGYYLFPAWGEPALYHVSQVTAAPAAEPQLEFRHPHSGKLLWSQSLRGEAYFAGKLDLLKG